MNRCKLRSPSLAFVLLFAASCSGGGGDADIDASIIYDGSTIPDAAIIDAAPPPADARPFSDAFVNDCTPTAGTSVSVQTVATGISRPVDLKTPTGDARLFVVEQTGAIRLIIDDALVATPFLSIESIVRDTGNEQGLLGLAFHPDYAQNGRFYVNYTAESPRGATVVAEYTVGSDANVANPSSARILLTIEQPFTNHNGGMIEFGPDGYLYISVGDGGSGGDPQQHGQDTSTLLGTLLRIDVDDTSTGEYGIPADNPFANSPNGPDDPRPEIWAYGLRNAWRFSFDRDTNDIYIADVGQNAIEEINVQLATSKGGENYGWRTMEGTSCFSPSVGCDQNGLVLPVAEYTHAGGACSITGGYVYRGACMPDLQGHYLFADLCTHVVSTIQFPSNNDIQSLSGALGNTIVSFGEDASGELYVLTLGGTVVRLVPDVN